MLGRLGWRGQCSCCNAPRDKRSVRFEEKRQWQAEERDMPDDKPIKEQKQDDRKSDTMRKVVSKVLDQRRVDGKNK